MTTGTKGERKRELILSKVKELFISQGYAATTMEDLVRYSGISKGSIYYHFESKEELFLQLLEKHSEDWWIAWREREGKYQGFREKLYGIASYYVEDFYNPLLKVAEEFGMAQKQQEMLDRLVRTTQAPRRSYEEILQQGVREGALREIPVKELALLFAAVLDGLSITYYEYNSDEIERIYKLAVDCFLNGVLREQVS
ncbi:TetR/AcrR family transcriptional regulator [Paenibacillus daejeonensis]|uniref:TetR/AcrR family transcriptional regulator n=1 Tax=Paenibacillus daejeonensis TaxID=135193 RepID=UPI00036BD7D1|nr:TetR/AcrR family transcriptional regulator [Paenibacillus daejeonensis]